VVDALHVTGQAAVPFAVAPEAASPQGASCVLEVANANAVAGRSLVLPNPLSIGCEASCKGSEANLRLRIFTKYLSGYGGDLNGSTQHQPKVYVQEFQRATLVRERGFKGNTALFRFN
jgi:hypothetical protein